MVSVLEPSLMKPSPLSISDLTDAPSLACEMSSVPPSTVTQSEFAIEPEPDRASVPPVITVGPS